MKRILFVDDEPSILRGLKRLLSPRRDRWHMAFADGGEQALAIARAQPVDVLLSDMRMPGMDGAQLMELIREEHPRTVRIMYSGYSELTTVLRAIPVAHQFLAKPSEPSRLEAVLDRACAMQDLLADGPLRDRAGGMASLPVHADLYDELRGLLNSAHATEQQVASLIAADPGMSAKLMQLSYGSFFGAPPPITSILEAVEFFSLRMIKRLALDIELFSALPKEAIPRRLSLERERRHAQLVGSVAGALMSDDGQDEQAQMAQLAGLLHDVGKLLFTEGLAPGFDAARDASAPSDRPDHERERDILGASHAEVGGYLLGIWGLPTKLVEAVALHHTPGRTGDGAPSTGGRPLDLPTAVFIADGLVQELTGERTAGVDVGYLEQLGVSDRLARWREKTHRIVHATPDS